MKSNLAYKQAMAIEPKTVGTIASDRYSLCVSEDCPVNVVLSMMGHMDTHVAAVVSKGNIFQGLVTRSAVEGGVMIESDIDESRPSRLQAGDIMMTASAFIPSELSANEALSVLEKTGYNVLPVLEDGGHFAGLAYTQELKEIAADAQDGMAGMTHLMGRPGQLGNFRSL